MIWQPIEYRTYSIISHFRCVNKNIVNSCGGVLHAFGMASGLLDILSFTFIVVILLIVSLLLVTDLTMFQVVFGLLLDFNRSLLQ